MHQHHRKSADFCNLDTWQFDQFALLASLGFDKATSHSFQACPREKEGAVSRPQSAINTYIYIYICIYKYYIYRYVYKWGMVSTTYFLECLAKT